ncbi:MAG: peptidylprolyl isomerase [Lentisphaerae bacterium]|nr:peptidylprolyl isomerase [Lentisphaerota bacterium]
MREARYGIRDGMSGWLSMAVVILALFVVAGCGKKPAPATSAAVPDNVVASVNGTWLTEEEVALELKFRIAAITPSPTGDKLEEVKSRMRNVVIEQFIVRTLLLNEAETLSVVASEEDRQKALAQIEATLPPGQTIEAMVASSPLGEAGLQSEVVTGIKIKKLLSTVLADKLAVSEEDVLAFMSEHKDQLKRPERVRARHILLQFSENEDDAAKATQKEQIEALRQKLLSGGDFAALAGEYSTCPSRLRGGDLGFFARGRMAKPFEAAAFTQDIEAIGPVIETQFGYHIVQVTEKEAAGDATVEQVTLMLQQRKQQEAVREYVAGLKSKAEIRVKGGLAPPATK